jgi:glyoxylase-like metal-dependent hydrolase (beta-lactamase superfamily II)
MDHAAAQPLTEPSELAAPGLPEPQHRVVFDRDGVRIHTFTAPDAFLGNSTHIIETEQALVVIDGQFVVPYATAFRAYADALGKPIERLYLSHGHVDHFFGIGAAFTDVEVHAASGTINVLRSTGEAMRAERATQYGPLVPDHIVVPQHAVGPGVDTVDGVKYEFDVISGAECDTQLLITLPDLGVAVAQDLIYSGAHLYVTPDTLRWTEVLHGLLESASSLFLAGHGPVADKAEVQRNIDYLAVARQAFSAVRGPQEFKAAMLAAYPARTGAALLDIYVPRLYGQAPPVR